MPSTELDDLKSTWETLNRKLERQYSLDLHQFKERKLASFRSGFQPLVTGQIIQIICGALLAIFGGSFWVDHIRTLHLVIEGILLHGYGIMLIIFAARDLFLIKQVDYSAPVLEIQKQIAELHAWHLRAGIWFAVAGCFIWTPLLLVIFYKLGADVWMHRPSVVYWLIASSFVCLALSYGLIAWSRRPGQERLANYLKTSSAG
ncbi:MAG: hypothetical protein ABI992_06765, partial [Chthoniobacterales bacterium]